MKWAGRLMTSVAALLLTAGSASALTASSESSAEAAWTDATRSNSVEAYATFVMMYPDSEHASSAYERLSGAAAISNAGALPQRDPLFGNQENDQSAPAILPGIMMII
jgi:hypothetical protein